MAATLRQALDARGVTARVALSFELAELLATLVVVEPDPPPVTGDVAGKVQPGTDRALGGLAHLSLGPVGPPLDFTLSLDGPAGAPTGFRIDLRPDGHLRLPDGLQAAALVSDGGRERLVPAPGPVRLTGAFALRIEGSTTTPARLRVVTPGSGNAVVTVGLSPAQVLLGSSGFGLHLPGGLVFDSSPTEAPPPAAAPSVADTPAWQGVALRGARLFLPDGVPLISGVPIPVEFTLTSPAGLDGRTEATVTLPGGRTLHTVVECHDPAATSLADCVPTAVEARLDLPADGSSVTVAGQPVTLAGGRPLRLRGRFARDLRTSPPTIRTDLSVEGTGPHGLVSVTAAPGQAAPKLFVTAAALATALVAEQTTPVAAPSGATGGAPLAALLLAAQVLSTHLTDRGAVVVHGVEVAADAGPAGGALRLLVDYSVDLVVRPITLGPLSVTMDERVPMRIRFRRVTLEVDLATPGLDPLGRFHLSFGQAEVGVEDPGGWQVTSPGSLLDVVGTRSGHGSTWVEVDLRFALDLGPVKVSGATLRATFDSAGAPTVELRGLAARLELPGLIEGEGRATLTATGLDVGLAVRLAPLNLAAMGFVGYEDTPQGRKVLIVVGLDLPAPVPFANSGLGLYGVVGVFGVNGALPGPPPGADPVEALLRWRPTQPGAVPFRPGGLVLGLGAVIGTVPDLGFAFSTKAMLMVATPNPAVRAVLDARVLGGRPRLSELGTVEGGVGTRVRGVLAVDDAAVTLALRGSFVVPHLIEVQVPVDARFPRRGDDWYLHIGADGAVPPDGPVRGPGPIEASILPELLGLRASAWLMLHGHDIRNLAGLGSPAHDLFGFAVGFGFAFRARFGAVPVVWAEVAASAAVGLGSNPLMLIGSGQLSGSLHLGPISIGASAQVDFQVGPTDQDRWAKFRICGEVDLFFFSLSGCVEIEVGDVRDVVPELTEPVLQRVALVDHYGRELAVASTTRADAPTVWPDAVPVLEFSVGPACRLTGGPFAQELTVDLGGGRRAWRGACGGDGRYGSHDLQYVHSLTRLDLVRVDDDGRETPLPAGSRAAWQLPRHGDPSAPTRLPGARELALLTWEPHLWTRNLLDGAAGVPGDPVGSLPRLCARRWDPEEGWALGGGARRQGRGHPWELRTEPSASRFASVFGATVRAWHDDRPLDELAAPTIPFPLHPGGPVAIEEVEVAGKVFSAALTLPYVHSVTGEGVEWEWNWTRAYLRPDEPLGSGALALIGDARELDRVSVYGHAPGRSSWDPWDIVERTEVGDGRLASVWASPDGEFDEVHVAYPGLAPVGLLGLRAVTGQAVTEVITFNQAAAAGAAAHSGLAAQPPRGRRTLLEPGRTYKLVVGMESTGRRPSGTTNTFPLPGGTFWFKTPPAPQPDALIRPGGVLTALNVLRAHDRFDPAYLARYLLGWTPGDTSADWFAGDPVAVHFGVDHILDLAERYEHDVLLRVRRTDQRPDDPVADETRPLASLLAAIWPGFAAAADRRLAELSATAAAGCEFPATGLTAGFRPGLRTGAEYDLVVEFPRRGHGGTGKAIPGVHFATSRWRDQGELLRALGFGPAGTDQGRVGGDLRVQPAALSSDSGDGAFEQALDRLGLAGWPRATAARSSALWVADGSAWLLAGVLLEAPEPIVRGPVLPGGPARLSLDALTCDGRRLELVRRDASGSRLLWLAATPFAPTGPLELRATSARPLDQTGRVPVVVRAAVASAPAFTGEPV
jgi:hypothetical protein